MDWISSQLASLIAQGQQALGKEVVVSAEREEDEDGGEVDGWVDDDVAQNRRRNGFETPKRRHIRGHSYDNSRHSGSMPNSFTRSPAFSRSTTSLGSGVGSGEDPNSFESPELRESMERARARWTRR